MFYRSNDFVVCFYFPNEHLQLEKNRLTKFALEHFLSYLERDLNRAQDALLPTYLPIFPDFPDKFCPHFSLSKYCSVVMEFGKGVFWIVS